MNFHECFGFSGLVLGLFCVDGFFFPLLSLFFFFFGILFSSFSSPLSAVACPTVSMPPQQPLSSSASPRHPSCEYIPPKWPPVRVGLLRTPIFCRLVLPWLFVSGGFIRLLPFFFLSSILSFFFFLRVHFFREFFVLSLSFFFPFSFLHICMFQPTTTNLIMIPICQLKVIVTS